MYMMIENDGVADIRGFTKLGLSSSRNNKDKIGQFGTGAKHGILTLLRKGLNPIIYCGTDKLVFYTQPNVMGETKYNDLLVKINENPLQELSFCLEFGELDWKQLSMGLRELVSNAIDSGSRMDIRLVEEPLGLENRTRVFIPLVQEVQEFFNELGHYFLIFRSGYSGETIFPKPGPIGPVKVYRKGVFVRELQESGYFDYNLGENLEIDECRNANDWNCKWAIGQEICKDRDMIHWIFERLITGNWSESQLEFGINEYHLRNLSDYVNLWRHLSQDAAIIPVGFGADIITFLNKKGIKSVVVPLNWYEAMSRAGIRRGTNCLTAIENMGYEIVPPTVQMIKNLDKIWYHLKRLGMTNDKNRPSIRGFNQVVELGEPIVFGYYDKGTVYINVDFQDNLQTYMEECAHYITGSTDGKREFQEFAFQIATRALGL